MKKILLTIILGIFLITLASASLESLGTFKQNDCLNITQTCSTCTYVNISSISNNKNSNLFTNVEMVSHGNGEWRYEICNTEVIGRHDVKGQGDVNGVDTSFAVQFEITPSGFINTLGFYIVLLIVLGGILLIGFSIKEPWFIIISGMGLMMLGIYSIRFGVVGFKDMFMTWGIGLFEIAVGATLAIGAGIQSME